MRYIVLLLPLLLFNCTKEDDQPTDLQLANLSTSIEYKQIDGVEPNLLSLDIYHNTDIETKKPIIIYVHGGGWSIGDKANQIENKVNLFQSLNYLFISVNYRLSPFPYKLDNPDRVMYPTHNYDVADAIKWIFDNVDEYGGDINKIALLGHSAGAHLVALTGTNDSFLENVGLNLLNIKGVATIDTEGYDVLDKVQEGNDLYINAFGTDTNSNKEASPIYNIENGNPYPKFFIAKRGNEQRLAIANEFINNLETHEVFVSQVATSIYNHEEINDAIGAPNETLITNPLKEFFEQCFE